MKDDLSAPDDGEGCGLRCHGLRFLEHDLSAPLRFLEDDLSFAFFTTGVPGAGSAAAAACASPLPRLRERCGWGRVESSRRYR